MSTIQAALLVQEQIMPCLKTIPEMVRENGGGADETETEIGDLARRFATGKSRFGPDLRESPRAAVSRG